MMSNINALLKLVSPLVQNKNFKITLIFIFHLERTLNVLNNNDKKKLSMSMTQGHCIV